MVIAVIGAQWGDEGKGKIVDLLAERFDVVVRYQGGHNAGHSVQIGNQSFVLHLLPSGIIHQGKTCVLGNGMVIDPKAFFEEADRLMGQGITVTPERVKVSSRAHLILPYHRALDHTSEERLGNEKVGTTLRGIGPAYEDKAGRRGIRVADALVAETLRSRIERNLEDANRIIVAYGGEPLDAKTIFDETSSVVERLAPFLCDTSHFLNQAASAGQTILLEGAQATLLDVDHGTYPFVTSSSTLAGGACVGTAIGPTRITKVVGILKAYTTRVGAGPFPTELPGARGEWLRRTGAEYGVTTGRERRTGWFDAVIARYATRVNGVTDYVITKLDVLSGLDAVPVCVGYEIDGTRHDEIPMTQTEFHHARPAYEYLDGWQEDISTAREFADLPRNAQAYVKTLEDMAGAPVAAIGVGPRRDQTLQLRPLA